jgi:hypothetical protein
MEADPRALLADAAGLDAMAAKIDASRALPWPQPSQQGDTVWFGAADKDGMVVSVIQSTYFEFGSGLVLPKTGITWQNRGASFRLAEDGWNALRPGRKPFHTLNPALAHFEDGRVMAYGTMGGRASLRHRRLSFLATHGRSLVSVRRSRSHVGCWGAHGARTPPASRSKKALTWLFMKRSLRLVMSWSGSLLPTA